LLDDYLEFVAARARPDTLLAVAYDLKVFFTVIGREPADITTGDVLDFIKAQRAPRRGAKVVRLEDGEVGLSARTIKRRLASLSGLFADLVARGDVGVAASPVPRGLAARRRGQRGVVGGVPLIRAPRTLPRVLEPAEVDAFVGALRTRRDRAMSEAMVLGGLRRCEILGLRLGDLHPVSGGCSWPRQGRPPPDRADLRTVLRDLRRVLRDRAPADLGNRPGVRGAEGAAARTAAVLGWLGRDRGGRSATCRDRAPDLPPAQAYLLHPVA